MDSINQLIQFLQQLQQIMPKLSGGGSGGQSSNPIAPQPTVPNNPPPAPSAPQAPQPGPQVNIPQSPLTMAPAQPGGFDVSSPSQPPQRSPMFGQINGANAPQGPTQKPWDPTSPISTFKDPTAPMSPAVPQPEQLTNHRFIPPAGMDPNRQIGGGMLGGGQIQTMENKVRPDMINHAAVRLPPGFFQNSGDAAKGIIGYAGPAARN